MLSARESMYTSSMTMQRLKKKINSITKVRKVDYTDLPKLRQMVQVGTCSMFGQDDVDRVFNLSMMGMVCTTQNDIVGCVFVSTYPNLPSLPIDDWESWIKTKYRLEGANPRTTQFVQLALYDPLYKQYFFKPILTKLFRSFPLVQFIILVVPPKIKFLEWVNNFGTIIRPEEDTPAEILIVFLRHDFVQTYRIRMAMMEDNDDLVPLIDSHSKRLKKMYGDFYIAEIIATNENRSVIVAENEGDIVGVMVFNETINYDLLIKNFHLECFYGLRKPSKGDSRNYPSDFFLHNSKVSIEPVDLSISFSSSFSSKSQMSFVKDLIKNEMIHSYDLNDHIDMILLHASVSDSTTIHEDLKNENHHIDTRFSSNVLTFSHREQSKSLLSEDQVYKGEGNAFVLEIAASKCSDEDCLIALLNAGFDLYPDKDYCVMCLPQTIPIFPLISQLMVRVSPLATSQFPQELYVVHKSTLTGYVWVGKPRERDLDEIDIFLNHIIYGKDILKEFLNGYNSESDNIQSYVIKCDQQLIGMAVLKDMTDIEFVTSRYQVSKIIDLSVHKPGCIGRIVYFVLSPIFQRHCKNLLMELHRLSDYSILFYTIYPNYKNQNIYVRSAVACVLADLIPVMPAKMPEYDSLVESSYLKVPELNSNERPYALYVSTPAYCGLRRQEINTRIVVVGASDAGLSFLINLIFHNTKNTHTLFTNVTLVSTHGIPYSSPKMSKYKETMIPLTSEISNGKYLSLISLATFVNIIEGVMTLIDRKKKGILINGTSWLQYDVLILTCGTQFQLPIRSLENSGYNQVQVESPINIFIINTTSDVETAIETLKDLTKTTPKSNLIIYGNSIETYCCLETLIDLNLSGITFIEHPAKDGFIAAFEDVEIERAIKEHLKETGVRIIENYQFYDWTLDNHRRVIKIRFKGDQFIDIPCMAAFIFGKKRISRITLTAINKANLIYDGHLVIDGNFKTNDPNIYAAGRITKYPRRFYADHMRHKFFNQVEIGKSVSKVILKRLMPNLKVSLFNDTCSNKKSLVPRYYEPKFIYAKLPTKLQYIIIKKPGIPTPIDLLNDKDGKTLITGGIKFLNDKDYFKIRLDSYGTIETIQVLSKRKIEKTNLLYLWGKHHTILNNLLERYQMGMIDDFSKFFTQPWIYALYHDRYTILDQELKEILTSLTDTPGQSVIEDVIKKIEENGYQKITKDQFTEIMLKFKDSDYYKEMESKLMEFLTKNITYLPMYLTPAMMNLILGAYENSPLFRRI